MVGTQKEQAPASFTTSCSSSTPKWGCLNLLFFQLPRHTPTCFKEGKWWLAQSHLWTLGSKQHRGFGVTQGLAAESPTAHSGGKADTSRSSREKLTPTGLQRHTGKPRYTNSWSYLQRKRTATGSLGSRWVTLTQQNRVGDLQVDVHKHRNI